MGKDIGPKESAMRDMRERMAEVRERTIKAAAKQTKALKGKKK